MNIYSGFQIAIFLYPLSWKCCKMTTVSCNIESGALWTSCQFFKQCGISTGETCLPEYQIVYVPLTNQFVPRYVFNTVTSSIQGPGSFVGSKLFWNYVYVHYTPQRVFHKSTSCTSLMLYTVDSLTNPNTFSATKIIMCRCTYWCRY